MVDGVTLWAARNRILPLVSDDNALHGLVLKAESPAGAIIGAHAGLYPVGGENDAD